MDFYDLAHMPVGLGLKVRYVGSDANGHETGGLLSVVDYEARTWAFARAAEYAPALLDKLGMEGAQMEKELIIFVTELLAVISLAAQHGASWSGSVVASLIDNDNANIALNTRRSRNRYVRYLLLVLGALEFRYRFRLVAYYINTHSNWLLDGIGRFERFSDKDDDEVREMIQKELIDEHVPGFVFEPLDELIKFFSSGDTVMKSFAIPDGSLDSVAAMFELSDCPELVRETAVSDECRDAALAAGGVGLGEIAAGTGALSHSGCKLGVRRCSSWSGTRRSSSISRASTRARFTSASTSWEASTQRGCSQAYNLGSCAAVRRASSPPRRDDSSAWSTRALASSRTALGWSSAESPEGRSTRSGSSSWRTSARSRCWSRARRCSSCCGTCTRSASSSRRSRRAAFSTFKFSKLTCSEAGPFARASLLRSSDDGFADGSATPSLSSTRWWRQRG